MCISVCTKRDLRKKYIFVQLWINNSCLQNNCAPRNCQNMKNENSRIYPNSIWLAPPRTEKPETLGIHTNNLRTQKKI